MSSWALLRLNLKVEATINKTFTVMMAVWFDNDVGVATSNLNLGQINS